MGVGKAWIASSVKLLQFVTGETSVDKRVEILNQDFLQYCAENRKTKYLKKLEPRTFGLKGTEPMASWNKAHVTATLLEWMQSYIEKNQAACDADPELRFVVA